MAKSKKTASKPVYADSVMIQIIFKRPTKDGKLEAFNSTGSVEYSQAGFRKAFREAEANRQKIAEGRENEK